MREPNEIQKQQYKRFTEILEIGKQRYISATGKTRGYRSGVKGQDYLTDKEREEAKLLLRQMFGDIKVIDGYAYCQGRSWKLPDNSSIKDKAESQA